MEREKIRPLERDMLMHLNGDPREVHEGVLRQAVVLRSEIAASALNSLWHNLAFDGEPLIFVSPTHGRIHAAHHPLLLNKLVAEGNQRKRVRSGQLTSWRQLKAPAEAMSLGATNDTGLLLKADMLSLAQVGDTGTIPSSSYGWFCYTFASGWSALAVYFIDIIDNDQSGPVSLVAVPHGRQDEWLVFLDLLNDLMLKIARRERKGRIEIIGGSDELIDVIKKTSFSDVVLPEETLTSVAAQRRIFDSQILQRYAMLRVPRLRKVLLIGPPGTGKTTLLKAEAAYHAKKGGLVFYVCAPPKNRGTTSWQQLSYALRGAAESELPTLVLVEDFEMFVSDPHELQMILNTLDGVATPDNPAGTLILATSNDPERIDPRIRDRPGRVDMLIEIGLVEDVGLAVRFLQHFLGTSYREEEHAELAALLLKQPGSHFREVCIAGAMRALEQDRKDVSRADLLWAHETILNGRTLASQSERFLPSSTRKRGGFFGK